MTEQTAVLAPSAVPFVPGKPGVFRRAARLAKKHPEGVFGVTVLGGFVFLGLFGSFLAPHDPKALQVGPVLGGVSADYPMGTNRYGQDVFSRVLAGARISLQISFAAVLIGGSIGSLLGILSGYYGRWVDYLIQRSGEAFAAFPVIILYFLIRGALGQSVRTLIITLAVFALFQGSRILRGHTIVERNSVYVEAARAVGCSELRVFVKHVFRNVLPLTVVLMSTTLGAAILAESTLAFLGLGLEPGTPSWGLDMSGENLTFARLGSWHLVVFPGVAISLVVLAANLLGDALRDIWDPRLRS